MSQLIIVVCTYSSKRYIPIGQQLKTLIKQLQFKLLDSKSIFDISKLKNLTLADCFIGNKDNLFGCTRIRSLCEDVPYLNCKNHLSLYGIFLVTYSFLFNIRTYPPKYGYKTLANFHHIICVNKIQRKTSLSIHLLVNTQLITPFLDI